eukprot:CAMPEP_0114238990 /NCGR_PEP_ID=MMETSP0058-20121206/8213_1 /TAXON_ID=36894 /ORGANISM="Pyramimonas parkeae, CCMP726" /LENGTH=125 /DNA_ID=CAMNT_0001351125 /DNA_START=166 /DNA_END=543 /DNA_ORIENTATION=-
MSGSEIEVDHGPKRDLLEAKQAALRNLQSLSSRAKDLHSTVSDISTVLKDLKASHEKNAAEQLANLHLGAPKSKRRKTDEVLTGPSKAKRSDYQEHVDSKKYKKKAYQGPQYINKMKREVSNFFG